MVYPSFKEQNLLSSKQFWGQKSPLLPANSFFVPQLVRRTEESISGQCNHQVPSTVNGTRKLGAGQDKEKTQKRHRKDTQKKKTSNFFSDEAKFGLQTSPRREDLVFFTGFRRHQQKSARGLRRYLWCPVPRLEPSKISIFFFDKKPPKLIFVPQKNLICYYNTSIHKPWLVSLFSKRVKAIFSFLKKNLRKEKHKNQRKVPQIRKFKKHNLVFWLLIRFNCGKDY